MKETIELHVAFYAIIIGCLVHPIINTKVAVENFTEEAVILFFLYIQIQVKLISWSIQLQFIFIKLCKVMNMETSRIS